MARDRKHIRLRNYDYASEGLYYVTLCTNGRHCFFGNIENGFMHLSDIGIRAEMYWQEIPNHFPRVELGEFVVMPNHIHGIIEINPLAQGGDRGNGDYRSDDAVAPNAVACNGPTKARMASISPQSGTLSVVMRSFKSAVTKWCNENHLTYFAWQYRFHDHIIRNQTEFDFIENYIRNNVANWDRDKLHHPS